MTSSTLAGWRRLGGPGAGFELLLPAQRQLVFEQQSEPFGVIEAARLGLVLQLLEAFGQAVEAERVQLVEGRMSEHGDFLSVVVAGTAQIGVVEERDGAAVRARRVELAGEERRRRPCS